jgi:hypothetical protein
MNQGDFHAEGDSILLLYGVPPNLKQTPPKQLIRNNHAQSMINERLAGDTKLQAQLCQKSGTQHNAPKLKGSGWSYMLKNSTGAIMWKLKIKVKVAESYMLKVSITASFRALSTVVSRGADEEADCTHVTATEWLSCFFLQTVGELTGMHGFPQDDLLEIPWSDAAAKLLDCWFLGLLALEPSNALSDLEPTWPGECKSGSFMSCSTRTPEGCWTWKRWKIRLERERGWELNIPNLLNKLQ